MCTIWQIIRLINAHVVMDLARWKRIPKLTKIWMMNKYGDMTNQVTNRSVQQVNEFPEWARDQEALSKLFSPTEDRIVILPDPEKTKMASGLLIATTTKGKIEPLGTVLAVGPGRNSEYSNFKIPMEIKNGMRVQYAKFAGDDYFLDKDGHWTDWASVGRTPTDCILIKVVRQSAVLQAWNK